MRCPDLGGPRHPVRFPRGTERVSAEGRAHGPGGQQGKSYYLRCVCVHEYMYVSAPDLIYIVNDDDDDDNVM